MLSETLQAVIITAIVSPISLEILRYIFGVLGKTKQRENEKLAAQEIHITNLESRINDMRDFHNKEMSGLRDSFNKEIEKLRNENISLQIRVAENEVKLTLKDETIARLSNMLQPKPTKK